MNKKYYKRQLTLVDIGFPIDNNLKKYYDYFREYFDIENLITKENKYKKLWGTFGSTESDIVYDKQYKIFIIYKKNLINDVTKKFNSNYNSREHILILSLLEHIFKENADNFQLGINHSFI